jgi:hypothetical protein
MKIKEIRQNFLKNLIETCLDGNGEVAIERRNNRTIFIIKLAAPDCIYKIDSIHLKCAVNPLEDCQTCQFKEVK